jgi:hypothetical protein
MMLEVQLPRLVEKGEESLAEGQTPPDEQI